MRLLLFIPGAYAAVFPSVVSGFAAQMGTGPLPSSIGLLGEPEAEVASVVADELRMVSLNLPDLLIGRKGRRTNRVKANAIKVASDAVQGSWLLSGFGETAAEREALHLAGVTLDRFVVLTQNEMLSSSPTVAPTGDGVDFVHISSKWGFREVARAVIGIVNNANSDTNRGGSVDLAGGTKSRPLGKLPWYAPFITRQQRRGNHSYPPQMYSMYNSNNKSTTLDSMEVTELEQSVVYPGVHSKKKMEFFGGLKLPPLIASRLSAAGIITPTGIQNASMLPISVGESVVMHSMTGSGKTLAFLLPILCQLRPGVPRQILVVVPTRELALQVAREAILLCGGRMDTVNLVVSSESPVLVGTAKAVQKALRKTFPWERQDALCSMKTLVCDEIDRLVDPIGRYATRKQIKAKRRHDRPISYILEKLLSVQPDLQVIACSATVGRPLRRYLNGVLSVISKRELKHTTTPRTFRVIRDETEVFNDVGVLHPHKRAVEIPSSIRHCVLPLAQSDIDDQLDALLQTLASLRPSRPLVFLPDGERLTYAVIKLQNAGMNPLPVHEALGFVSGQRLHTSEAIIASNKLDEMFRKTQKTILLEEQQNSGAVPETRNGQEDSHHPILIASHAGARGLHFEGIDYVFIIGRPNDPDEYTHLAGRTGRLGRHGVVVSILSYRDKKRLQSWATQLQITFEQLNEAMMEKGNALAA